MSKKHYYQSNDVLNNYYFLHSKYPEYLHYFQTLKKPKEITSLIGIEIELSYNVTLNDFMNDNEINKLFKANENPPFHSYDQNYFFTIFNTTQTTLINIILPFFKSLRNQNKILYIGIYICNPIIYPDDFIEKTHHQLKISKSNQCYISILNTYD
jgi:hypothetical protein